MLCISLLTAILMLSPSYSHSAIFYQDTGKELLVAAHSGETEAVKSLLAKGANVNVRNGTGGRASVLLHSTDSGETPLMLASAMGHLEIVKALLEKRADVNAQTQNKKVTALMFASAMGHIPIVEALLAKGANINAITTDGITALVFAACGRQSSTDGQLETVKTLLEKHGKVVTDNHKLALLVAALRKHVAVGDLLKSKGVIVDNDYITQNAIRFPFIPRMVDQTLYGMGIKDLWVAAGIGDIATVQSLLDGGANLNVRDTYGITPLSLAARAGQLAVVRALLDKGADINAKNDDETTPLVDAVRLQHIDIVKLLLEKGADVNAKSKTGQTALSYAIRVENAAIATLLRDAGAKE